MIRILCRIACRGLLLVVLGGTILSFTISAEGQEKLHAGEGQERLVPDAKDWSKDSPEMKTFQAYRQGDQSAAVTPEILDHGAQWFAYRFTHEEFQRPKTAGAKEMHDLLKDALDLVIDPQDTVRKPSPGQLQFKDSFDKKFIARLREVTKNPKPVARVNAVMVLARLAATGDEEAVAALLDVVKDEKENDGIKMHAFRGIRDFFALGQGDNPNPFRNKQLEGQCIAALLDFLNRPAAGSEDAAAEEKAALHYIRRHAVAALGETRYPAASKTENKRITIERPTALTLLRIMRKDKINPPPTLEEQVNAAVGLCRLKSRTLEQYHVDYTAQQLGWFLADFTVQSNGTQKDGTQKGWKLLASRLSRALDDLQNDVQGRQEAKYVDNVVNQGKALLEGIIAGQRPNPDKLISWLEQNKPAKAMVYEGMPDSIVRGAQKAAE